MTENNRLNHEEHARQDMSSHSAGSSNIKNEARTEELHSISPVFRKISKMKMSHPSPEKWRKFSHELNQKLETADTEQSRTLRDRIAASDNLLSHWLWIALALLLLFAVAIAIGFTLDQPTPAPTISQIEIPNHHHYATSAQYDDIA